MTAENDSVRGATPRELLVAKTTIPDDNARRWLAHHGVPPGALLLTVEPYSIRSAPVVHDRGRFAFNPVGDFAFVLPIAADGDVIDLAAWTPSTGDLTTLCGDGAMIGEEIIGLDGYGTTGLPIPVFANPIDWLRADCVGVVIADWTLAAHRLSGIHLAFRCGGRRFVDQARQRLRVPPPVFVQESLRTAA